MNIVLFGATGAIGQAVLDECLAASDIGIVLSVGNKSTGRQHPKLREVLHRERSKSSLLDFNACFFCIEVSADGMTEAGNKRTAYRFALATGQSFAHLYPQMTFVHVADAVPDSSERERDAWARERQSMEKSLLSLPSRAVYLLRPAVVQPRHSVYTSTASDGAVTPEAIGLAMLAVARSGSQTTVLEAADINAIARAPNPI